LKLTGISVIWKATLDTTYQPQISAERDGVPSLLPVEECVRYYPPDLSPVTDADPIFANAELPPGAREIDIFVDVPFCNTICGFCPFNVYPYEKERANAYLRSLELEITGIKRRHDFSSERVRTVWVGGGTPSILEETVLDDLLSLVRDNFDLAHSTEFTVEIKPDMRNLAEPKITMLQRHGIKRISMGVQSTDDGFLRVLGRGHTGGQAIEVIRFIKAAGFALNIDMMYRLPGQSARQAEADIETVASLGVDHISWFPYVAHEGTSLASRIARGRVDGQAGRDEYLAMFTSLSNRMAGSGFEQYTPYHFANTDRCHYHVGRWRMPQRDTLGLGPGAFSYFNGWIYANEHDPVKYERAAGEGRPPVMTGKKLTETERITRLAVLGIKFFSLNAEDFRRHTGKSLMDYYESELSLLGKAGLIDVGSDGVTCTLAGRAFNNDIATVLSTDTARRTRHPQGIDLMRVGS
jgi:oxygen-independent coproporphyrinogen-3 oxidase